MVPNNVVPDNVSVGENNISAYIPQALSLPRPFPDISKIEMFDGKNFRRWQERVDIVLDMHGVAAALTQPEPSPDTDQYT